MKPKLCIEGYEPPRQYQSIGELADEIGIATSNIRFWESEFSPHLKTKTTRKGIRQYKKVIADRVKHVHLLVHELGFALCGARQQIELHGFDRKPYEHLLPQSKEVAA